jgi:hypothetical protein
VLVDAYRLPVEFADLLEELVKLGCDIVTTKSIIIEFLGGTKGKADLEKKVSFLEKMFGRKFDDRPYLPLDRDTPDLQDILIFSRQANKFGIADFELYQTLKKYASTIVLVSRNHKDFTQKITERISFITLLGDAEIHTYGLYKCRA